MRKLCEEFKHFRGQPIEVITEGMRFCGIDVESDEDGVVLVDRKGRLVRIENKHIDAVIQPQMRLRPLCERHDCEECEDEEEECRHCHHDRDDDRDCD